MLAPMAQINGWVDLKVPAWRPLNVLKVLLGCTEPEQAAPKKWGFNHSA